MEVAQPLKQLKLLNLEQQFEILRNAVPSAPNENMEITDRNHTLKQQNNELSRKNDELNTNLIAAQKKRCDLENKRQSLITAIRLLHEELKTNDSGEIEHPMDSNHKQSGKLYHIPKQPKQRHQSQRITHLQKQRVKLPRRPLRPDRETLAQAIQQVNIIIRSPTVRRKLL